MISFLVFPQSVSRQEVEDAFDPFVRSETVEKAIGVNVYGSGRFSLSSMASLGESRDGSGQVETLLVSVQPSVALPGGVTLGGYGTYVDSDSSDSDFDSEGEQYQVRVAWAPAWLRSFLSLELSSDWNRTRSLFAIDDGFNATYRFAVTLSWGVERPREESFDQESYSGSSGMPAATPRLPRSERQLVVAE